MLAYMDLNLLHFRGHLGVKNICCIDDGFSMQVVLLLEFVYVDLID